MNERIKILTEKTVKGEMWVEPVKTEYDRTDFQKKLYESWKAIKTPKVRGEGFANLSEGFYGIEEAFSQAMKNTVREYWRKRIKNKPREISGRLYFLIVFSMSCSSGDSENRGEQL